MPKKPILLFSRRHGGACECLLRTAFKHARHASPGDEKVHCGVFFCRPRAPLPAHLPILTTQ